jgi:hypothetical protein
MTEKAKSPGETSGSESLAADCYAPTFNLLQKMESACKIKCSCYLMLRDGRIVMRWNWEMFVKKHGEKRCGAFEHVLTRFDEPYVDMHIERASHAINEHIRKAGA